MKRILSIFLLLFSIFIVVGCSHSVVEIESISIVGDSIPESILISEVDDKIDDIKISVLKSDKSTEIINVSKSMISPSDLAKLEKEGEHNITIYYEGFDIMITVVIKDLVEDIKTGVTFNRKHPDYYQAGVPLVEDAKVVYINFDGFAQYYYEELIQKTISTETIYLKQILEEGVKFNELRTTLPSITNPCQNMILTGSTSAITKNVYRYYDKTANVVVQQERENANDTIIDAALDAGLSVASVAHYLAESKLTISNPNALYVYADNTNPKVVARGEKSYGDHFSRFEQLNKLISLQPLKSSAGTTVTLTEIPDLTIFYADDIDAVGHNEADKYTYTRALTEEGRMQNVLHCIKAMDAKLGEFIELAKKQGVYDKLTFFLVTDHGMAPFGLSSEDDTSDYGKTKTYELQSFLKKYNSSYAMEMIAAGKKPSANTSVVAVGANLNLQLTFLKGITDEELEALKEELLKQYYVGKVYTRKDLEEMGYWVNDTDMIISPAERYCFSSQIFATYLVRGQHDSGIDSANLVYGAIWGNGIKKNYTYKERAFNYDFGTTMAAALGITIPNANGLVLDVFDKE